ncbi:DUF2795 domain-containing protein [Methanosarcina horonobensis]|nr:DUF2795 domain-containing protein [Methanosarcina horonobensis]
MQTSPASVQKTLKDIEYPAEKRDLVEHARQHDASDDVINAIKNLPDKAYTSAADVNKELEDK